METRAPEALVRGGVSREVEQRLDGFLRLADAWHVGAASLLRRDPSNQRGYAYWTCWPSSWKPKYPLRWPWPCPRSPPAPVPLRTLGGSGVGHVPQAAWWDPTAPRQPRPPCRDLGTPMSEVLGHFKSNGHKLQPTDFPDQ